MEIREKNQVGKLLNLTQNLSFVEYLFRPTAYSRIIGPGSNRPFEFEMLSKVEENLQFDIKQHPSTFKTLYNEMENKLAITFWRLLTSTTKVWVLEEINLFLFLGFQISISLLTKGFLNELGEESPSGLTLAILVISMVVIGLGMTIFHSNSLLYNYVLMNIWENKVKVN